MPLDLKKATPVPLRSLGLDERWLQDQINRDPTILGLGDLEIAGREHSQPRGGRIDFLMRKETEDLYYEVEIMLGALDESHIIRTIEYWDIERQRRPSFSHHAVIVAETIAARFFNVVRLLNRAVPIIAIQLSAFRIGDEVFIHPVKVLDVMEEIVEPDVADVERSSRSDWQNKALPEFLEVVDHFTDVLRQHEFEPRITYNRHHIALGTTRYNFCWFHPRSAVSHCFVEIQIRGDSESRDSALVSLQDAGVDASPRYSNNIAFGTTISSLREHSEAISQVLIVAEQAASQRSSTS